MIQQTQNTIDPILDRLASVLAKSTDTATLVRPLLELMEHLTGLDSVYLTRIDWSKQVQTIVFTRNCHELVIPEGLEVPLEHTLCRRAIEEQHFFEPDVPTHWADAHLAIDMGIQTYLSAPVRLADEEIYGTLCALGADSTEISPSTQRVVQLFADLIAHQIDRERLIMHLQSDNRAIGELAMTDALTGLPNRFSLRRALKRELANVRRMDQVLHLAFIDLDQFKEINDRHGHDVGDQFLKAIADSLRNGLREGDFVARYGGDEFVAFGISKNTAIAADEAAFTTHLCDLTSGRFTLEATVIDYPGASIGVVTSTPEDHDIDELIERADQAMYRFKKNRRATERFGGGGEKNA
ncbi:sensor domain-containing diguanylate cyclase [Halothiobacillus sp.]|uniref:sensor domain-containing diguanylate cyclase n=1 Tax=Halothiobacillus sp. TaxID=1891311 RepID=UPI00260860A8|nr:sensor domain-containing diguanylate cyclase [Halothiobacillus sp.]